jgi:hypothetical protein
MSLIRINRHPTTRSLRVFAVALKAFCLVWAWLSWRKGWAPVSVGLLAMALITLALAIAKPGALRGLYLGLSYLTFPIGWVMSHVILGAIYFVVFTPIGWLLRMFGHDALKRRFEPSRESYWDARANPEPDPTTYFRQH